MEVRGTMYDAPRWREELGFHLHLEELRATIRHNMVARSWSYERTAAEIGTTVHRLRELLDGRAYILAEDRAPFEAWCEGKETEHVYPEQAALAILCQDFRPRWRAKVRERLARRLRAAYQLQRLPVPMWIYMELKAWMQIRRRSYLGRRRV